MKMNSFRRICEQSWLDAKIAIAKQFGVGKWGVN